MSAPKFRMRGTTTASEREATQKKTSTAPKFRMRGAGGGASPSLPTVSSQVAGETAGRKKAGKNTITGKISSSAKSQRKVAEEKTKPDTLLNILMRDTGHISEVVDSTTGQVISTPEASRGGSMLKGAAQGTAADFTSTGGTFLDLLRSYDTAGSSYTRQANQEEENAAHYREMLERGTLDDGTPITASMRKQLETLAARAEQRSGVYRQGAEAQHAPISRAINSAYETADRLSEQSAENIAAAKEGLGGLGQFAVDVGVAGTQLAGDALIGALLAPVTGGASALAPMAVRGFGSGTQQARQEGATLGQQVAYGVGSAALSAATEKISNIGLFRRAFGAGVADNLAGKLVSRFGENTAIQTMNRLAQTPVGRIAASMLGEGSEEFIEDVFQPVLQRAIYDSDARFDMSEALYDFAVGAVLGGVGGGVDITRRRATDAAGTAQTEPAPVSTTQAQETAEGTATPLRVGRVTTIQQPYQGTVPVQAQKSAAPVIVDSGSVQRAANRIEGARGLENTPFKSGFKSTLKRTYKSIFQPAKGVPVSGVTFKGRPYTVDINSNVPGKVISDPNLTAEKLALLDILPQVVQNGEYVGSGKYVQHGSKTKQSVRYDYFETPVTINGKQYIAAFSVDVEPNVDNYRTHRLIEMDLRESPSLDTGKTPAAADIQSGPVEGTRPLNSDITIAPGAENVNSDILAQILFGDAQQEGGQTDGLGAADAGSLPSTEFERMQGESGEFHPINSAAEQRTVNERQRAAAEVPVTNPRTGQPVQKTVSTILNSPLTSNDMARVIEQGVVDGKFDYIPVTDRSAATEAQRRISRSGGYKTVADNFLAQTDMGQRINKYDLSAGIEAYNAAVAAGDNVTAYNLSVAIAQNAHDSAQVVQAMNMMNRLTPEGKLLTLRRFVDRMNERQAERAARNGTANTQSVEDAQLDYVEQNTGFTISDELATNYLMAETEAERTAAWDAILTNVAQQVPSTFRERANFWRYTMMLLNPTTHARNFAGNAIQWGARKIKNGVGAAIERAAIRDQSQRTKSFTTSKELRSFTREQYKTDQDAAMGGGKYSDSSAAGINREIQNRRKVFSAGTNNILARGVQAIGDFNTWLMDAEDVLFNRSAYIDSFAQALQAKGITAEQARRGGPEVDEARAYAIQEAQRATYRNTTALSEVVSKMGRYEGTNPVAKALSFFADAELPFRRTPANVLTTGLDYSVVGLGRGIKQAMFDVRSGKRTAADAIDLISSGLTGTGIMALGAYLVAEGLLSVGTGDDDREAAYNEDRGEQGYSIRIGDKTYTLDWALPAAMPLFAGASIMESIENDGGTFGALVDAMAGISQVVLETSMMSSLDDFITYWSYADNKVTYALDSAATDYLSQYVPTIGGKIASAFDDTARSSYVEPGTGQVASDVDYFLQSILKKIPGARNQLQPDIDLWGNERTNGTFEERLFQSFVSPGTLRTVDTSKVDEEIRRLADELGDSSIYPAEADKYFTVNGARKNLTAEEYTKYAKILGKTRYDALSYAFNSPYYDRLSDAEKVDVISDVYQYANGIAKKSIVSSYEPDKWIQNVQQAESNGIKAGTFIYYRNRLQSLKDSGMNTGEANSALRQELLNDNRLTAAEKTDLDNWIINDLTVIPKDVNVDYSSPETFTITQMSDGAQRRWSNIKNRFGIDAETYQATWKIYQNDDLNADQKRAQMAEYVGGNASALYREFGKRLD